MDDGLTQPAKLLLLSALLAKDNVISHNAKAFLKELALRRDAQLAYLLGEFESKQTSDASFLERIHAAIEKESEVLYADLFHDTPTDVGKQLSRDERKALDLQEEKSLIYGEVEYHSFYQVMRKINPSCLTTMSLPSARGAAQGSIVVTKAAAAANASVGTANNSRGLVFYDLGSGTGKAVMLTRMLYDFRVCKGVELLEGLFAQSKVVEARFNAKFKPHLTAGRPQAVELLQGSLLKGTGRGGVSWWEDGDVVFANSTCFDDDLMESMSQLAARMRPGAFFVTFTKGLSNCSPVVGDVGQGSDDEDDDDSPAKGHHAFELLDKKRYKMSWGPATVFIHRKLLPDGRGRVNDGYALSLLPCDEVDYDDQNSGSSSEDEDDEDVDIHQHEAARRPQRAAAAAAMRAQQQAMADYGDEDDDDDEDYYPEEDEDEEEDDGSEDSDDSEDSAAHLDDVGFVELQFAKAQHKHKQEQAAAEGARKWQRSVSNTSATSVDDTAEDLDDVAFMELQFAKAQHEKAQAAIDGARQWQKSTPAASMAAAGRSISNTSATSVDSAAHLDDEAFIELQFAKKQHAMIAQAEEEARQWQRATSNGSSNGAGKQQQNQAEDEDEDEDEDEYAHLGVGGGDEDDEGEHGEGAFDDYDAMYAYYAQLQAEKSSGGGDDEDEDEDEDEEGGGEDNYEDDDDAGHFGAYGDDDSGDEDEDEDDSEEDEDEDEDDTADHLDDDQYVHLHFARQQAQEQAARARIQKDRQTQQAQQRATLERQAQARAGVAAAAHPPQPPTGSGSNGSNGLPPRSSPLPPAPSGRPPYMPGDINTNSPPAPSSRSPNGTPGSGKPTTMNSPQDSALLKRKQAAKQQARGAADGTALDEVVGGSGSSGKVKPGASTNFASPQQPMGARQV